jgi:hypothetical protein
LKYNHLDWPLRTLLIVGLYFFQYKTIAWLRGKKLPKWVLPAMGLSVREMEDTLHISIRTVKSHVYNLYRKLKVKNRHQLIHLISTAQQENS